MQKSPNRAAQAHCQSLGQATHKPADRYNAEIEKSFGDFHKLHVLPET